MTRSRGGRLASRRGRRGHRVTPGAGRAARASARRRVTAGGGARVADGRARAAGVDAGVPSVAAEVFVETACAITAATAVDAVLRALATGGAALLGAAGSAVYVTASGDGVRPVPSRRGAGRGLRTGTGAGRVGPPAIARAAQLGRPLLVRCAAAGGTRSPRARRRLAARAALLLPVRDGEATAGVVVLYWAVWPALAGARLTLLEGLVAQAGNAVRGVRRYAAALAQAERDAPTALLNKAALERSIDHAVLRDKPFAVVLVDIDAFKQINDGHGHRTGDAVIQQVAEGLRACCRAADVAGRIGGDEFALVSPRTSAAEAARLAARVGQSTRRYRTPAGAWVPLGLSVGWACYPLHGRTRDALLDAADRAMYGAKRRRRKTDAGDDPADGGSAGE